MPEVSHSRPAAVATEPARQFASDTWAGMCPQAWRRLEEANQGHDHPYGDDRWTLRAADLVREVFACDAEVFMVLTGTASNALALASLCHSYHSVVCHQFAHIETDECGAPEFASHGTKLLTMPGAGGKLTPAAVTAAVTRRTDIHYAKPRVLSLTQATEVGTVYTPAEIQALTATARSHGLRVHMDGARFANAVAHLGCHPADITWRAGVDVLCLGGSKNGLAVGDLVVFFDRSLAQDFAHRCKQAGQLAAKMRFITAPWVGLLEDGVWLANARHANTMARRLADGFISLGVPLRHAVEANELFVDLPAPAVERLHLRGWHFYDFIAGGGWRFVTAWDSRAEDVDALLADVKAALDF